MPLSPPRVLAVQVLLSLQHEGALLTPALERAADACADPRDAALVKELCYGTLRWQPRLEVLLSKLLQHPLKAADTDVQLLLLLGLYQLTGMRVPAHAAVQQTVEVCRVLGKPWATKLVNGVLRRFLRERVELEAACESDPAARYAHPHWFIEELQRDWPDHWWAVLEAGNLRPPFTLRVNRRHISRAAYLAELAAADMAASACRYAADGVVLEQALDVASLPGFADGLCSVQDEAAQLAGDLLDAGTGMRVLDACAAPGGKACHTLERHADLKGLVAVERDAGRAQRIHENLRRLGLEAEVLIADATQPSAWWDGVPFDRILLDAPCSASGVVRRHPDVKVRRTPTEVGAAAGLQRRLFDALWPLLAPRGKLLYVTCSVFQRENALQLAAFLIAHGDAEALPLAVGWGRAAGQGRQILTGEDGMDGFYYACVQKRV